MVLQQLGKVLIPRTWGLFKAIERLFEFVCMSGELGILESQRLFDIHQLIQSTIKDCTYHIHLLQFKVMMRCLCRQHANRFKTSNGSKGFSLVDTLNLGVALCHQSRLVRTTTPFASCLFLKIHLVPMTLCSSVGLGTNSHTWLRLKLLS